MKIFGILNITPDSFSDGGKFQGFYKEASEKMMEAGAFAIDIGAESTRPGAVPITLEEEWRRLEPVLSTLLGDGIIISLDTRNPGTVRRALAYNNVKYINDVSGFQNDEMVRLAADNGVNIVAMHSLSVPTDRKITLKSPPVRALQRWVTNRHAKLTRAGIRADKIIFDPGIGFGKTPEQSRELISRARELAKTCHNLGTKILYGHSRKSFLGADISTRDLETAKISADLQNAGVDYIRVHNIEINRIALTQ